MLKEGICVNKQTIMDIISHFNRKSSEFVVEGYHVNTGLVKMHPRIKGNIIGKIWNPKMNKVEISFSMTSELTEAIDDTQVEFTEWLSDFEEIQSLDDSSFLNEGFCNNGLLNHKDVPACGMAFRTWLCNP
jgi:hypothetical protein